ncbi:MAG: hypothetical protein NC339_07715 [Muribaculaceae bacterium]|nr:hypothetical protein [Muribaculaceae bacterium]
MKQNNRIEYLLKKTYEVEGLLLLLKERGDDFPADALSLLAEKVTELQGGVMMLPESPTAPTASLTPTPQQAMAEAAEIEQTEDAEPAASMAQIDETIKTLDDDDTANDTNGSTLDEMLARKRARDINKAFTLNDKYRFCRELFHGSEADFTDTLDVISAMSSFDEAEEYFYDDLCWDPDNEDVKAFMEIVKRHF